MLGVEIFERFVVQIDYGEKTLTLIDPASFRRRIALPRALRSHSSIMSICRKSWETLTAAVISVPCDVVVAINGTAVLTRSLSDVRRSLKVAPIGRVLTVTYSHGGASSIPQVVPRDLIAQ